MPGQILIGVAALAVVYHVVATMLIYDNLRRRGIPVSFLWLRLFAPKYAGQYKRLTTHETGRTGPLFYHWVVSINAALVGAVAGMLMLRG